MVELRSLMAFFLTMFALILVSSFVSLQVLNISYANSFCNNFSVVFNLPTVDLILEHGKGKLIKGNITNTGFDNEFVVSSKGPDWIVIRPKLLHLESNEMNNVFVYLSPEFGTKGRFDAKLIIDGACVHIERTIKTNVK